MVLVGVELQGFGGHVGLERVIGVGKGIENESHGSSCGRMSLGKAEHGGR
jgi:hypothetical protein